ncbi:chemoreceptor glutamine deamidase CheD, partial [Burkholderia vietnamiensis]|nr:chemoreceptor glutamine deamidase CheD [Burkholderia vietnamiensis]
SAARARAKVELFAAPRPSAPPPARPRIELFGARSGGAGVQPAVQKAASPYAANLSRK